MRLWKANLIMILDKDNSILTEFRFNIKTEIDEEDGIYEEGKVVNIIETLNKELSVSEQKELKNNMKKKLFKYLTFKQKDMNIFYNKMIDSLSCRS